MDNEVGMSPQEIADAYSVLAGQTQDYTNSLIGRAGAAQSSLGTLADQVKGQSQTAGMGNYTYNRLVRPQLDSLTSSLVAKGVSDALNKQLYSALEQARRNYSNSGYSGTTPTTSTTTIPDNKFTGDVDKEELESINPYDYMNKDYAAIGNGMINIDGLYYPSIIEAGGMRYYANENSKADWIDLMNKYGITGVEQ